MPAFRAKIRANSLFVFDDVHLLADKPATQKELMLNLDVITQKGVALLLEWIAIHAWQRKSCPNY